MEHLLILISEENPKFPSNLKFDTCQKCLSIFSIFNKSTLEKIKYRLRIFAEKLCDIFLDLDVCYGIIACKDPRQKVDFNKWKAEILKDKPLNYTNKEQSKNNKQHILQLSDIHLDLEYTENSLADCSEYFCCRPESGSYPLDDKKKAKYWGTLAKCDIPLRTVEALLEDTKKKANIKAIIWTGDNISHDVWHQNKTNQTLPQNEITNLIKTYTRELLFILFLEIMNFTHVDNMIQIQKMIQLNGQNKKVQKCGNNGQMKKLTIRYIIMVTILNLIKAQIYDVIIIGHIPPGDNTCSSLWAMRYQVLIDRFENTIKGQFFGHTHNDHIETVISSSGEKRAVGSIFIAPSATTYSYQNPSYRIFEFEGQTLINYYQYRLDLEKANQRTDIMPAWDLAYNFKNEYGLIEVNNQSIYELAFEKLVNDEAIIYKYISHYYTGNTSLIPEKINESVRKGFQCMAQNVVFNDRFYCFGLYSIQYPMELLYQFLQALQGKWFIWNDNKQLL
ncbi:ser thr protein phosphatase family protein, putative [Ichthyophthirius multifiliis]|uniref:Ser thr protein phosphatase family protein, putative n=1 Tax=Ichthyophthirius multifiliis TaxID=5932 RepID=G0R3B6_ICHMU|nr:ser thr protein phosphatase family protein, putative [Ichthyophthirius multifiliis]EGR28035.1 ser thr protein phosphatase family protein, putative [Ichthyophthirius multifiliis]|eukprot:XP_004027380.1 ser thr protein phosphatase family protein, putative [Ichthyophthirius multifiliis]